MALNPDCTPGVATKGPDGSVEASCGCGWTRGGFPSKRKAYAAQRAHRFPDQWRDRQGDVWVLGDDGLMHTPETAPFPREHVEKKWGPLELIERPRRTA